MNEHEFESRIREALHTAPEAEQLARLEAFWHAQSRAERRQRLVRRAVATAACVAALAGAGAWVLTSNSGAPREGRPAAPVIAEKRSAFPAPEQGSADSPPPVLADAAEPPNEPAVASAGRPATDFEQLIFAISTRQTLAVQEQRQETALDAAIEQLAGDPAADADAVVATTGLPRAGVEQRLLERLPRASETERLAMVRLLGACGGQRAVAALAALGGSDVLRPAVVEALERIVGVERLADVARQSRQRSLRTALLERILTADSEAAMRELLAIGPRDALAAEALSVADGLAEPPTGLLMQLLQDDEKSVRLAAAVFLGRINGPEITHGLIALVTGEPPVPTEAWVALLACRGESAREFLAVASQEPRWLGRVNNARVTWARMVQ